MHCTKIPQVPWDVHFPVGEGTNILTCSQKNVINALVMVYFLLYFRNILIQVFGQKVPKMNNNYA